MLKYIFKALLTLIAFVACTPLMMAQNSRLVVLEKPGKLSKHIKKDQYPNIQSLTIMGTLNNSDILILSKLSNLTELNLGDVEFEPKDYHPEKRPFVKSDKLNERIACLPSLPNLRKITVPARYWDIDVRNLPNLKVVNRYGEHTPVGLTQRLDTLATNKYDFGGLNVRVILFDRDFNSYKELSYIREMVDAGILDANVCITPNNGILIAWSPKITMDEWSSVSYILSGAYSKYPEATLVLPKTVKTISPKAFNNPRLKSIDLSGVESIEENAFDGCVNLTELTIPETVKFIGSKAFKNSGIKSVSIPSTVKKIQGDAFEGLESVEFLGNYPPEIEEFIGKNRSEYSHLEFDGIVYVPEGKFNAYNIGGYKYATLLEKGKEMEYVFNVEKPGTLNSYITDANANNIISLTITGRLYDTDFDAIYKCKNLRSLDLSHCFIMESYETAKQKHEENAALLEIFSGLASMANANELAKFKAGAGNLSNVAYTEAASKLFGKALKELESGKISPSDQCVFPVEPFYKNTNPYLRRIVFPIQMKKVPFVYEASNLTEIILPPYAEEIPNRAFQFADINSITFPPTLKILGKECFIGTALEKVDLSNTQVEELISVFESCNNLKTFKGNTKLKKLYGNIGNKDVVGYFYTPEKPYGIRFDNFKTIHIPKGCKAGWSAPSSYKGEIVDDIVL